MLIDTQIDASSFYWADLACLTYLTMVAVVSWFLTLEVGWLCAASAGGLLDRSRKKAR